MSALPDFAIETEEQLRQSFPTTPAKLHRPKLDRRFLDKSPSVRHRLPLGLKSLLVPPNSCGDRRELIRFPIQTLDSTGQKFALTILETQRAFRLTPL